MQGLTTTRRSLLVAGAAIGATLAMPAVLRAAPYKMKFSSTSGPKNPISIRITEAAARIKEETGGELDIAFFPAGQLGGEIDSINQVRSGAVEFMNLSSVTLSTVVPSASIGGVGFAFSSYDQVFAAMDGDLGALIRKDMEQVGFVGMPNILDYGFRHLTATDKPIKVPADVQGFKMRVPPGPLWTSLFQALGAAPATVPIAEVYTALLTGVIDGTDLPLLTMADFKVTEVQKYVSLTSHMWDGPWIIANKDVWASLAPEQVAVLQKNFAQAAQEQRADVAAYDKNFLANKPANLTIVEPDREAFRKKLVEAGFYKEWREKFTPEVWSVLEKYTGPLA